MKITLFFIKLRISPEVLVIEYQIPIPRVPFPLGCSIEVVS